jgi:SAM-dependent methyltransferase
LPVPSLINESPAAIAGQFIRLPGCWVCGSERAAPWFEDTYDLRCFAEQDPELAAYTGLRARMRRCGDCGFGQPEELPALPNYFDRKYDLRWAPEWMADEFEGAYKDLIIRTVLRGLARRLSAERRTLLDVGCHVGRFLHLARAAGWRAEGVELNPQTAAFAARRTGLPIHQVNVARLADEGRRFDAITLTDVLEHIPEPVSILAQLRRLLLPGGWIAVKVPCGPSQLLKQRLRRLGRPGVALCVAQNLAHVNQFDPRSLRLGLSRAGFVELHVQPAAPELFPFPRRPTRWASRITRLTVYMAAKLLPGGVYTPLALNLQAFGRAPAVMGGNGADEC